MKTIKIILCHVSIVGFLLFSSCSKEGDSMACEINNSGTVIIENSRSTGILKIYFDQEPRSGNTSGDLNIRPGERANSDLLAGQKIIYALLDTSTCSGEVCLIRNESLPMRTIDLMACQEINLTY